MPKRNGYGGKRPWTDVALRAIVRGSRARTPLTSLSQMLKRTPGAIRQKARSLGFSIGVKQRGVATRAKQRATSRRLGIALDITPLRGR